MPAVELLVTDLDGTLWHDHNDMHPQVLHALREVERRGLPLLVATGRRVASTRDPLARFGIAPPAVVLNGSIGLDLASGTRFFEAPFASTDAVAVLKALRSAGIDPVVYVESDEAEVFVSTTPSTNAGHIEQLGAGAKVGDLDQVCADLPVFGFSVIGRPHGLLVKGRDAVGAAAVVHLDRALDFPGMASMTVAPLGQSKWDGVTAFCRKHDLNKSRVLAIGDGPNDVELLTNAAVRVVPADAHPAARALADHTVPSARHGGWAGVLEFIG